MIRPRGGADKVKGIMDGRLAQAGRPFLLKVYEEERGE
jgi:hypothetical protein